MNVINGKEISAKILEEIKYEIRKNNYKLKLGIILVGEDEASKLYIKYKVKRVLEVGIETEVHQFNESATEHDISELIHQLNSDKNITGFFIQAPIPKHLDISKLTSQIESTKDVDGMSPISLGNLFHKNKALVAATPLAVMEALKSISKFSFEGKNALIINRSTIIGKPLAALLLNENATVQICHSHTKNIFEKTKSADIIILGTGKSNFLSSKDVKSDAIIIDCGAPISEFFFENENMAKNLDGWFTPVPGGIGPLTIACLIRNCTLAKALN